MLLRITRAVVMIAAALLSALLIAQSSQSFEVASIHLADPSAKGPNKNGDGFRSELGNGRFAVSSLVYNLINRDYGLPNCVAMQGEDCPYLSGGPAWIRNDLYQIRATLPEGIPSYTMSDFQSGRAREIYLMIGDLLRERFQLKMHHEMREVPVFLLTVKKNGHKMKPTPEDKKTYQTPDGVVHNQRNFVFGLFPDPIGARDIRLWAENTSMNELAAALSSPLNRPVVNRTGLEGGFDFELKYAPNPDAGNSGRRAEMTGPELFSALQEQAGLRLESAKEKIDVIVIDSIERPSEN